MKPMIRWILALALLAFAAPAMAQPTKCLGVDVAGKVIGVTPPLGGSCGGGSGGGSGTVTSVGISSADGTLGATGSPVTTSGVIDLSVHSAPKWTTARTLSFTGDATGSGSLDGSVNLGIGLTLPSSGVTAGAYSCASVTLNAKGLATAASNGSCVTPPGGTSGQVQYNNAGAFGGVTPGAFFTGTDAANLTGALALARLANQGTTTTVLHGNAAGTPAFGPVNLAADVTGRLPYANVVQIAANTVVGNASGSTADAGALAMPSCSTAGNALTWTTNVGFGCGAMLVTPQGRLSLTSNIAVMTADVSGATTIYYVPYQGPGLPINGVMYPLAAQLSFGLNTTAHASGGLYDVFAYISGGNPTLCTGPAWTNSTTRSAAISQTNGLWVNTSTLTCTLTSSTSTTTIAAGQATYLGTVYATANGQTGFFVRPAGAAGGGNPCACVFNAYNRVFFAIQSWSSSTGTYTTNAWRMYQNSANNRIRWVDGLAVLAGGAEWKSLLTGTGFNSQWVIALDATSSSAGTGACDLTWNNCWGASGSAGVGFIFLNYNLAPTLGFHFLQLLEGNNGGGSFTTGNGGNGTFLTLNLED